MTRLAVTIAFSLILGGTAVNACALCENEDELQAIYAYMDFTGMTEQQIAVAKLDVLNSYHKKQMQLARSNFISRFHLVSRESAPDASSVAIASNTDLNAKASGRQ